MRLKAVGQADEEVTRDSFRRRLFGYARRLGRAGAGQDAHRLILRTIAGHVRAMTGSFAVYVEAEQALSITATVGYPLAAVQHLRIPAGAGVIGQVFETRRAVLGRSLHHPKRLRYRTDSYIAVPITMGRRPLGVVAVADPESAPAFDRRDLAAARIFASVAALSLECEQMSVRVADLTRVATVDPVSGLYNRQYFDARLEAEVQRARRHQLDLALLMVDVDNFKRINDTFGHLEGDRALRQMSDVLRSGVRIFDVCARFGGEEFALLMPGATEETAVEVAERLRADVHERSRLDALPLTISIGVGLLEREDAAEDLVARADAALLEAKRAGKNVVRAMRPEGAASPRTVV